MPIARTAGRPPAGPERDRALTGVEQHARLEPFSQLVPQVPQTAIVGGRRRGGGLDLDGDDGAVSAFEDDVDLTAVPVAVVGLARGVVLPGDLPPKLHRSKGLEDHAGDRSILHERSASAPIR